jgi:hypothetical protein
MQEARENTKQIDKWWPFGSNFDELRYKRSGD